MARDEQIRVDLTAKDDASKTIDKVADAAEALEKLSPEIEITADGDAAGASIDALGDDIRELQRADAEIVLRARVDAAKGELRSLQAELDQTGEKADQTARQLDRVDGPSTGGGLQTRGNAIADLTGPLGEASGAASDFAGVFDGLGDIAADAASKLGASAASSARIAGAIGGLGVVVAGAAAVWQLYTARQEAARKKQEELVKGQRDLTDALREGDRAAAAKTITELYGDAYDAAKRAGVPVREFTEYLTGQRDELPTMKARYAELTAAVREHGDTTDAEGRRLSAAVIAYVELTGGLYEARDAYLSANGSISEQDQLLLDVTNALRGATGATDAATSATDALAGATEAGARATGRSERAVELLDAALGGATGSIDKTTEALAGLQRELDMEKALRDFSETFATAMAAASDDSDDTAVDILGLKQAILDVATYAGLNPVQVKSLLDAVDAGNINGVRALVEDAYRRNPARLAATLVVTATQGIAGAVAGGVRPTGAVLDPGGPGGPVGFAAGASIVNVTQVLPRGYRERDALTAATQAARRSGGLYRRAHR